MAWHPNDLVTDADLVSYEASILTAFGQTDWHQRRTKALEDWLFPQLRTRGYNPHLFRTRYEADAVYGYTAGSYSDLTEAAKDTAEGDVPLAAIFATANSDVLYVGSSSPFMGIFLRMLDNVSSVTGTMTVAYWGGAWITLTTTDHTMRSGKTLNKGGSVTWTIPPDWSIRTLHGSAALYWAKVTVSATPTGAVATQVGTIRSSSLRAPATYRTLQLIFREAPTGADGPWLEKAAFYAEEAEAALQRAMLLVSGEFDTDRSDLLSEEEAAQTDDAVGGEFLLERR